MSRALAGVLLAALVVAVAAATGAGAQTTATTTVVMSGLDNPRGLAFGPEGALYVAEAGRGGDGPCIFLRGAHQCYGPTGAISRLWHGQQQRVVTGLPSYGSVGATGPHDVGFSGRTGYVTIGLGLEGMPRSAFAVGDQFGWLLRFTPNGHVQRYADLAAYEFANNPDGGPTDSQPYGLLVQPGGQLVAEAGGNDLIGVTDGQISTLAVFPSRPQGRPTDAVPTAVVLGADGAYYVSELTGVPFAAAAANIYRVVPGHAPIVVLSGFTTVIDIAFGPDGSLYVLEHSTGPVFFGMPGRLLKIAPDGTRTTVIDGLTRPGSVLVGPHGELYVSNRGISVGTGEVLRIEP